jgi:sulfatase maturation enzyme AslB (radical SAM superfamily)
MFDVISKITIKLSTYCNLACEYCHQMTDDKKQHVTFNQYQELYQFLMKTNLSDTVEVTLTGGEISLLAEEYETAVKTFRKVERNKDVKFTFAVVSNGTNIEQLFKLIKKKDLNPKRTTISWDGLYSMSKSRASKVEMYNDEFFKEVIRKIGQSPWAKEMNVSHAITPTTIAHLHESLVFALDNGIKNFGFYYIHEADYSDPEFLKIYDQQITLLGQEFAKRYADLDSRFVYFNWQLLFAKENLDTNNKELMRATTLCHKLGRTVHFDPLGDIYGCIYFGDHRALRLGDLEHGAIDKSKYKKFSDQYFEMPGCNLGGCGNSHCFECPASNYVHNGKMANRFSNTCEMLSIEKRVYYDIKPTLPMNEYDKAFYWMEEDHLEQKNFNDKHLAYLEEIVGIPLTDEEYVPEDDYAKRSSPTYKNVVTWMKKTPKDLSVTTG